jgi:hypothetical protein
MRMPWGKYVGYDLEDVPLGYLGWVLEQPWLMPELREAIVEEVARRLGLEVPCQQPTRAAIVPAELRRWAAEIVESGFRQAARRHHPDLGGSEHAMRALLEARECLRAWLN